MRNCRIYALALAFCLICGLFSCGGEVDTREFYLFEDDIIEYMQSNIAGTLPAFCEERDGMLVARNYEYDEDRQGGEFLFNVIDIMSGECEEYAAAGTKRLDFTKKFQDAGTREFTSFALTPDGNVVQLFYSAKAYGTMKVNGENKWVATDTTPQIFLAVFGKDGRAVLEKDLGSAGEVLSRSPYLAVSDGGYIYLMGEDGDGSFVRVSPDGEKIEVFELPESESGEFSLALGADGKARFYEIYTDPEKDGKNVDIYTFSDKDTAFGEAESYSTGKSMSKVIFADGCVFCYRASGNVYSFDSVNSKQLFSFMDFGIDSGTNWLFTMFDTSTGFVTYLDPIDEEYYTGTLRKADVADYLGYYASRYGEEAAEEVKERKTIEIVAAENEDAGGIAFGGKTMSDYLSYMNRFIRQNMQYKVKFRYLDGRGSDAAGALMRRMAAGEVPDVIMFNYGLKSTAFAGKDLFEDLYTYMDADKEHGRDYFLPCVLSSFENDKGELPYLTASFNLSTMLGLRENFENADWSLGGFLDFAEKLPEDRTLVDLKPDGRSKSGALLYNLMRGLIDNFVDYDKKECYFETDAFKRLLEVCKNAKVGTTGGFDAEKLVKSEILCTFGSASGITNYLGMVKGRYFGEDAMILGYPHEKGESGIVISPVLQLSIFKDSENAQGAWELMTSCVDSQADIEKKDRKKPETYASVLFAREGFPSSWAAMDVILEYAPQIYVNYMYAVYTDKTTGEKRSVIGNGTGWKFMYRYDKKTGKDILVPNEHYNDPVYISEWSTKWMARYGADAEGSATVIECSEDDVNRLREAFGVKCVVDAADEKVMGIILEEAEEYFNGVRELDDVVRMIDDRVRTRVNE